jgi:hypothetical protein
VGTKKLPSIDFFQLPPKPMLGVQIDEEAVFFTE